MEACTMSVLVWRLAVFSACFLPSPSLDIIMEGHENFVLHLQLMLCGIQAGGVCS